MGFGNQKTGVRTIGSIGQIAFRVCLDNVMRRDAF